MERSDLRVNSSTEDGKSDSSENNFSSNFIKKLNFTSALHNFLITNFNKLGEITARHPKYFIIVPLIICLVGFSGFLRMNFLTDVEVIYYPPDAQFFKDRVLVEHFFPLNSSQHFLPLFMTRNRGYGRILIESKDKGNIFRKYLWKEILEIDEAVRNFTITYEGKIFSYKDLCAIWDKKCFRNRVLDLYEKVDEIGNGSFKLNYPIMMFPVVVPMFFGGLKLDDDELYIKSATALSLSYFLKIDTNEDRERAYLWEKKFASLIEGKNFENIHFASSSPFIHQRAVESTPTAVKPYTPFVAVIMILFSISNSMMLDWVRSKFYLGLIGLFMTALATGASFGFLMHIGIPTSGINFISPFLIVGIGLDDIFVMLGSWRRTRIQDSVEKRLGQTYADAGLSILITSLTNMVSFLIGATAPILAVRIFCIYTATSIFVMYMVHMTFFGGFLALFAVFERDQRHSVCFRKVKAISEIDKKKNICYSLWCAGGISAEDPWNKKDNEPHTLMLFFRDFLGSFLTKRYAKYSVFMCYLIYLMGSIYGFLHLTEGYDRPSTVRSDSSLYDFITMEETLFRHHPYSVQVVITGDLLYTNSTVRKEILDLHKEFEKLSYVAPPALTLSWMRGWFLRIRRIKNLRNITDEREFINQLRTTYLVGNSNYRSFDVAYNEDYSRIMASRFFIQTRDVMNPSADTDMMNKLREVATKSPLNVTVFNPVFILFDQGNLVKPAVIQATIIATICMIIISMILIPNMWCSIYIGFAIISIEIGVIGFMALWSVRLSFISMICLIMCIGFSVDFTAHISYSYCNSKANTPNEKIMESLYALGLPIVQGGISTICSVFVFAFVPSGVYVLFFKVVFLVVLFSGLHGLFVIPVLLAVAGPDAFQKCKNGEKNLMGKKSHDYSSNVTESKARVVLNDDLPPDTQSKSRRNILNNLELRNSSENNSNKILVSNDKGVTNNGFID